MSSPVEQIKERITIVELISSYFKLEKAGRNLKARCPFHNEKTPSFFVSPERDSFHCFGCAKGGDIFTFTEEIEGVDFKEALRILADRAGVSLQGSNSQPNSELEVLYGVLNTTALFYEEELKKTPRAITYLKERGVSAPTIENFNIGYAPNDWQSLLNFLKNKGFDEATLLRAGLIIRNENGRLYDRFRNRIMFPITDSRGRVVAFSGRYFGEENEKTAKYINSPETPLYNKSKILYGFQKAKKALREKDVCLLVEGQMDVVLSHEAGVTHAVAASGTALTEAHLLLISRLTENIVLAFDADPAGFAASRRGIDTALAQGFNIKLISLQKGKDPGDIAKEDPEVWRRISSKGVHIVAFLLNTLGNEGYSGEEFRKKVEEIVLPYVAVMKSPIEQAHFVREVAENLSLSEDPIWEVVRKLERERKHERIDARPLNALPRRDVADPVQMDVRIERRLSGILLLKGNDPSFEKTELENAFYKITDRYLKDIITKYSDREREELIFETEILYENKSSIKEEVEELLINLSEFILRKKLRKTINDLKYAEAQKDEILIKKTTKEFQELSIKLNNLTAN